MHSETSPQNRTSKPVDDSFWAALFAQEESNIAPSTIIETGVSWSEFDQPQECSTSTAGIAGAQNDPWQMAADVFTADETMDLRVTGFNKGGLLVNWHGLQGFVPASQLIDFPQFHLEIERINALRQWQHKRLHLKIIEINAAQNRFILSERAALVKADERRRLLHDIAPGEQVQGQVTNLTNFGAFVDLGGIEGLIHISEMSWSRVDHPGDIVQPGEEIVVRVLSVDADNGRVALSLKRLKKDPWQSVNSKYEPGQMVEGVISKVVNFGAFVQLEDELEGLIHISELAEGTFLHPRNVVWQGQKVRARVLHVDGAAKRLALSLRGVSS